MNTSTQFFPAFQIPILIIVLCMFLPLLSAGQEYQNKKYTRTDHSQTVWAKEMYKSKPNVRVAEEAFNLYFKKHPNEKSKEKNIFRRWLEDAKLSISADGYHIPNTYEPKQFLKPKPHQKNTGTYRSIGPNYADPVKCSGTSPDLSGGFCDRVYINPGNLNNLFAGFSYGGLWVSTDQGDSWSLTDAAIPNGTNTYANRDLYYGEIEASTLDATLVYAATEYALLKSTNSGLTWSICPSLNREDAGNTRSYYIALSKSNTNTVLATFGRKVFRSTDGGDTWTVVFDNSNGGRNHYYTSQYSNNSTFGIYDRTYNFFGLESDASNSNIFYLGIWNAQNQPEILTSTDGGISFQPLINLNQSTSRTLPDNLVLKASQNNTNKFFIHTLFTPLDSLYVFNANGNRIDKNIINARTNSFGTEVNTLEAFAINPANEDNLYAGFYFASSIMKSSNGGQSFTDQTSGYSGCPKYVHPDVRSIDVQGNLVLIGSDGGLAISKDGMASVSSNIGREISAVDLWGFSSSQRTDLVAAGCDHGPTKIRRFAGDNGWLTLGGGDASDLSINSSNEKHLVFDRAVGYQFKGTLNQNNDLFSDTRINDDISLDQVAFHPFLYPIAYAKEGNSLKRVENNFTTITQVKNFPSNIEVVRIAPEDPQTIYVLSGEVINKTENGGNTWQIITPPASVTSNQNNITDMVVGANKNQIWASYGNWQKDAKIVKSEDGGVTWSNISTSDLPLTPVSQIAYQAGTDGGIYLAFAGNSGLWYRNNSMGTWQELGSGLPSMGYIRNVYTVPNKGVIRFGSSRGAWEHDLYEQSTPVAKFAVENNEISCGETVDFIQNSLFSPQANISYQWLFEGANLASSTDAAPSVEYLQAGNHAVTLITKDSLGASDTLRVENFISVSDNSSCEATSVFESDFGNIEIYPNPATHILTVKLLQIEPLLEVEIVNTNGQVMQKRKVKNQQQLDLVTEDLSSGVYLLHIRSENKFAILKFFKN